jgi:hypothetical protein
VTRKLIQTMRTLAEGLGSRFATAVLAAQPGRQGARLEDLREAGVEVIDCAIEFTPDLVVPGEGHPNAAAHARWADCLGSAGIFAAGASRP